MRAAAVVHHPILPRKLSASIEGALASCLAVSGGGNDSLYGDSHNDTLQGAMRKHAENVERSFAHILDRGGMRRTWLRGRENVHKRRLIHFAGHTSGS